MAQVSAQDRMVGGPLQYGSFNGVEFEVCAYAYEVKDEERMNYSYLGFDIVGDLPELEDSGFFAPMKALGPGAMLRGLTVAK